MSAVERRAARWPELISELLQHDLTAFPHQAVGDAIATDFGTNVAWNWMEGKDFGFELRHPVPGWPDPELLAFWERAGLAYHPLIRWFATTGSSSPMSVGRVPRSIAPEPCLAVYRACLEPSGHDQQLSIPYVLAPDRHHAFVLGRSREDYSDEDLDVARRLQPLLMLLERQVRVLGSAATDAGARPVDGSADGSVDGSAPVALTGRERAVLVLLERGRTAEAIARELGISPRTVHKHLENLYRKLGVSDRLRAVMTAREAGVLLPAPDGEEGAAPAGETEDPTKGSRWSRHELLQRRSPGALTALDACG